MRSMKMGSSLGVIIASLLNKLDGGSRRWAMGGSSPVTGRESSVTWLLFGGPSGSAVRGARAVVSHGAWC